MYYMFLLIIIATAIFAAESTQNPEDDQSSIVIARYSELVTQFLGDSYNQMVSPEEIEKILKEMSAIERQRGAHKLNLKKLHELRSIFVDNHSDLVNKAYSQGILISKEANITDLLLQTFEFDLNSCNKEYYQLLDELHRDFVDMTVLSSTLVQNRETQIRNCWDRMMDSLSATSTLLGLRYIQTLNVLTKSIIGDAKGIVLQPSATESMRSHELSVQLAKTIADLLMGTTRRSGVREFMKSFKILIELPCKTLISKTREIMFDIYGIMAFIGLDEDFIADDDAINVNRYLICDRILADLGVISVKVLKFARGDSGDSDSNLITQQTQLKTHDLTKKKRKREDFEAQSDDNSDPNQTTFKEAIEIEHGIGRGRNIRYPTIWSDGSRSMETKDYLVKHWFELWHKHFCSRKNTNYHRYIAKLRAAKEIEQAQFKVDDENDDDDDHDECEDDHKKVKRSKVSSRSRAGRVMRIVKAIAQDGDIKYSTVWSDGTTTLEDKEYLIKNWIDRWVQYVRAQESANLASFLDKKH